MPATHGGAPVCLSDIAEDFRAAMLDAGIPTDAPMIADARIHRFDVAGEPRGKKNGWYVLHRDDPAAGAFGNWRAGSSHTWCSREPSTLTERERRAFNERMEEAKRQREQERENDRLLAVQKAKYICAVGTDARDDHPYLVEKGVGAHGLNLYKGRLVVPARDAEGELSTVQFIDAEGNKQFLKGGAKKGCFYLIGGEPVDRLLIAEGFATAATVHEATGLPVAVAFDSGNLKPVATALRAKFPDVSIFVCGDDDRATDGNPGRVKAAEAAAASGAVTVFPTFTAEEAGTDFNDLAALHGLDAVRNELVSQIVGTEPAPQAVPLTLQDFFSYLPLHKYLFIPDGSLWPSGSVNAVIPPTPGGVDARGKTIMVPASQTLDKKRSVEQMTWAPGEPLLIRDRLINEGGWTPHPGRAVFNLYVAPVIAAGDAEGAGPWLDHITRLFGEDDATHIIHWLAHRVQKPGVKVNHCIVLGGGQGIGKDSLLEPVKYAIGAHNFADVSPTQLIGRFNGFLKSVILRVSEARDMGETSRFAFYEALKVFTAAPPDVLRCDEKNLREHMVPNVTGVILTTNHKTAGFYLPADDRRHFVAWSDVTRDSFPDTYFPSLYQWFAREGYRNVAAFLAGMDLSGWNEKAPPPKTSAFWDIVDAGRAPEDAELADLIDRLISPDALTLDGLISTAQGDPIGAWLGDRANRRRIPHRMESAGYTAFRNDGAQDGLWKVGRRRMVVYAKVTDSHQERAAAVRRYFENYAGGR